MVANAALIGSHQSCLWSIKTSPFSPFSGGSPEDVRRDPPPRLHRGGENGGGDAGGGNRRKNRLNPSLLPRCRFFKTVTNYVVEGFFSRGVEILGPPRRGFQEQSANASAAEAAGARLAEFLGE